MHRQYAYPPVREAIFSVSFREALPLEALEEFCRSEWLQSRYPQAQPLMVFDVAVEQQPAQPVVPSQVGHQLSAADDNQTILRATTTDFNLHNFNKYLGWDKALAAFLEAWQEFGRVCPAVIRQVSIRYINEMVLPAEAARDLRSYLTLLPQLPPELPGRPGPFFIQLNVLHPTITGLRSIVTQAISSGKSSQQLKVLLDLAVIQDASVQDSFDLEEALTSGRTFKNDLFESCITPATRTLFDQAPTTPDSLPTLSPIPTYE